MKMQIKIEIQNRITELKNANRYLLDGREKCVLEDEVLHIGACPGCVLYRFQNENVVETLKDQLKALGAKKVMVHHMKDTSRHREDIDKKTTYGFVCGVDYYSQGIFEVVYDDCEYFK